MRLILLEMSYVANYSEHKIVVIDPSGNLTNFAGSGSAGDDNGQKDSATFDGPARIGRFRDQVICMLRTTITTCSGTSY